MFDPKIKNTYLAIYPFRLRWRELQSFGNICCRDVGLLQDLMELDGTQNLYLCADESMDLSNGVMISGKRHCC